MSARVTIKDIIITELTEANEPLSYDQLATRAGLNQPSVRLAMRQLQIAGRVRMFGEGYRAFGHVEPRTWVLTGQPTFAAAGADIDTRHSVLPTVSQ